MARYGRDFRGGSSRSYRGGTARGTRYGRDYGRDFGRGYDRDHARGYEGGWGMTNLYNTIMRRGPGDGRYDRTSYNPPLREGRGGYAGGRDDIRRGSFGGSGGGARGGGRFASDRGSVGVHYRPYDSGYR